MTSLAILSMGLAIEALRRLWWILYSTEEATEVDGKLMALIAFIGVVVNVVLAFVLGEDHVHMPGGECGGGGGHDHSHGHSHGGGGCAGASHAKEQEQTSGHGHDHNHGDGGCDLHNDNNNANNNNVHSHDHNHGEGACDSHNAKNENDGHSHDHNHDEEAGNSHTHNEHSHNHNHNEESTSLLPSPTRASYSSITEVQHIDEVLPDDQSIACNSHTQAHDDAHARNVNLHATYLHVLADLAQSVVVFIAGLIIWWKPHWQVADPICTLIFSILVCWSTVGVIRSSLSVLLEEVPPGLNWEELYDAISQVDGVSNVHDLHIWSISHGNFILSVHANAENVEKAYRDVKKVCNKRNISHLTVQLQPNTMEDCVTCTEGSVHQCR